MRVTVEHDDGYTKVYDDLTHFAEYNLINVLSEEQCKTVPSESKRACMCTSFSYEPRTGTCLNCLHASHHNRLSCGHV